MSGPADSISAKNKVISNRSAKATLSLKAKDALAKRGGASDLARGPKATQTHLAEYNRLDKERITKQTAAEGPAGQTPDVVTLPTTTVVGKRTEVPVGPDAIEGMKIANYGSDPDAWVGGGGTDLVIDRKVAGGFASEASAVAHARSLDTDSYAVARQTGGYAIYSLRDRNWNNGLYLNDLDTNPENDANIQRDDGKEFIAAVITRDDYVVQFGEDNGGFLNRAYSGNSRHVDPMQPHFEAFGPNLQGLETRDEFLGQMELAIRDQAFASLDLAEESVQGFIDRMQGSELSVQDRAQMGRVIEGLKPINAEIAHLSDRLSSLQRQEWGSAFVMSGSMGHGTGSFGNPTLILPGQVMQQAENHQNILQEQRAVRARLVELRQEASVVARDFPALLRVENLDDFKALSEPEQMAQMREKGQAVLADIHETRENIEEGDIDVWTLDGARSAVETRLGVTGERAEWSQRKADGVKLNETLWNVAEGVVGVGLTAAAGFVGGPFGVALAVGGLGLNAHVAIKETNTYFERQAASNINLDPNAGLLPEGAEGHWGFVAAAWVGVGLDAAAVGSAIKSLRAAGSVKDLVNGSDDLAKLLDGTGLNLSDDAIRSTLQASRVNAIKAETLGDEAFDALFGAGEDAVTRVWPLGNGGHTVEVITRESLSDAARAGALQHEWVHLQQLSDPKLADDLANVMEPNLARWGQMSGAERSAVRQSQLRLEIDARERLLATGRMSEADASIARTEAFDLRAELEDVALGLREADTSTPRLFASKGFARRVFTELPEGVDSAKLMWQGREHGNALVSVVRKDGAEEIWHVPQGVELSDLAIGSSKIDDVEGLARQFADQWSPAAMSKGARDAASEARDNGEYWLANLLEKQDKGRFVELQIEQLRRAKTPIVNGLSRGNLPGMAANTGLDYRLQLPSTGGPDVDVFFDVMSGTFSNLRRHSLREPNAKFRLVTF